ncbi:MAG: hypothetical protein Q9226_005992 [Calogaya cf. arnoldii]
MAGASAGLNRFEPGEGRIIGLDSFGPGAECCIWESTCDKCLLFIRTMLSPEDSPIWNRERQPPLDLDIPDYPARVIHSSECVLCRLILAPGDFKSHSLGISLYVEPTATSVMSAAFRVIGRPLMERETSFQFIAAKDEKECAEMPLALSNGSKGRYPAENLDSDNFFDQITKWCKTCIRELPRCIRERSTLPNRLLRLGTDMDSSNGKIHVSKTRDLSDKPQDIQYLALSYCWGGISNSRTLKENISLREKHGLNIADLPAVIRDAITVTRRLDFKYLWVDALCICQDDGQEWGHEAALMADIYGGSVFTISALSSSDANMSFLRPRQRSTVPIGSIFFSRNAGQLNGDRQPLLFIRQSPLELDDELTNGKLSDRGWPLQERILAPGVLHYGRDQIFWECNEDHSMSETGDSNRQSLRIKIDSDCPNTEVAHQLWYYLLADYMRRDLSVFSDRLHAISGLAARLRKMGVWTGRYVAGLWESNLVELLLWRTHRDTLHSAVPVERNTQISTWSWAHADRRCLPFGPSDCESTLLAPAEFKFDNNTQDMLSMCTGAVVPSCQVVLHGFVQDMNKAIIPKLMGFFRGSPRYVDSFMNLDDHIVGLNSYYTIRMMDNASMRSDSPDYVYKVEYLILEQADSRGLADAQGRSVCKRIGRLTLRVPFEDVSMKTSPITPNSKTRYADIFLDDESRLPFLTNGQWREIILI